MSKNFKVIKLMERNPVFPDINPIENLGTIIKICVHENGKQYSKTSGKQ